MRFLTIALCSMSLAAGAADEAPPQDRAGWKVIVSEEGWFAYPADADEQPGGMVMRESEMAQAQKPAPEPKREPEVQAPPPSPPARCDELRDKFAQRLYELRGVQMPEHVAGWVRENVTETGGLFLLNPFMTTAALGRVFADPLALSALGFDLRLKVLADELARCEGHAPPP